MVIKNVDFTKLGEATKTELKEGIQQSLAKKVGVSASLVSVELSAGSVKVVAEIGTGAKASADSIRAAVSTPDIAASVLEIAKKIEGVKKAAVGEIEVTQPEAVVTTEGGDSGSTTPAPETAETAIANLGARFGPSFVILAAEVAACLAALLA